MFEEYPIREGSDSRPAENPINRGEQDGDLLRSLLIVANAVTNDDSLAYQSVLQALSDGLAYEKEKSEGISATWIYERTVQKSRLLARGIAPITARKPPEMSVDQRIWPLVEKFDWRERLLCVLHYSLGWPGAALASLLDVSEGAIQTQLSIFEQRFKNSLKDLRSENLAGFNWHQAVVDSIQRRYAVVDAEVKDLEDLLQQIQGNSLPENQKNAQSASLNGHLIGSVGLVVITICIVIVLLFVSKLSPIRQQLSHGYFPLGSTRQPDGQPLAGLPLTWLSSQKTIRERMQDSAKLWQTIFIETQLTDYGPASYIGAPRQYQLLAWIKQPDESIQLFGLLSQNPSQVNVVTKGHSFELNPLLNYSANGGFLGSPGTLLENETLRRMIFPVTAPWLSQQGTLRVYNTDRILERDTIVVDWYNSYGQRKARLWLDAKIGIVLRLQQFGGRDSRTIINDMIVTELTLDQNFPPSRLAAEMQQVKSSEAQGPGAAAKVILPTPTAAIPITQRQSLTMTSLPKDYNLPASELFFQFSNNPQTSNALSDTAKIPAQIFADRYFVASTKFGLPWMLRCRRSPDGYRLAFNTGSDGTSTPDDSLLWLDLRYPDQLFEPFPELHAQAFAFSPDNTRIAVFGFGPNKEASGIFIIDLSKVENRVLFELPEAHSLVWNPDGESLALVGKLSQDGFQEAAVIHIRTGQISFHAPFPEGLSHIPESWPMANWGLPFPQTNDGMDDCSRPAQ